MNLAEFYQACDRLIETGWKIAELERLCHFRDSFKQTSLDLPDLNLDIRHWNLSAGWCKQAGSMMIVTVL